jgi:hypothetical protein
VAANRDSDGNGDNGRALRELRHIQDPTALTTQQLTREISALKEVMFTRLDGMDRAIILFNENITRVPTDTDKQISHLREFILQMFSTQDERFEGIQTQFRERDIRVEQTAKASKEALDAALQAAKEAVGKQNDSFAQSIAKVEAAFTKQMDQLGILITNTVTAINDKIDDLKGRLALIEGVDRGKTTAVVTQQASNFNAANLWGIILGIVGTSAIVGALIISLNRHG